MTEFDSSSDEESCEDEALVEEESDLGNLQITRDVVWAQHLDFPAGDYLF